LLKYSDVGEELAIGATAVGVRVRDGVVLGAEKRVAYGFYVLSHSGKKVYVISDRAAIAAAGVIADMQTLARVLKVNYVNYMLETKRYMPISALAKLTSVLMFSRRILPYIAEVMVGGVDEDGTHLYVLDMLGSLIEDNYAALGTGAKLAISVLESRYRPDMTVEEARQLAIDALRAAISRDPVSGDGIELAIITRSGTREEVIPLRRELT